MPREFKLDDTYELRFRNGAWHVFDRVQYKVDFRAGGFGSIAEFERKFKVKVEVPAG